MISEKDLEKINCFKELKEGINFYNLKNSNNKITKNELLFFINSDKRNLVGNILKVNNIPGKKYIFRSKNKALKKIKESDASVVVWINEGVVSE